MHTRTILVVDDSPLFLGVVGRTLMEAGYRVLTAATAANAWTVLESESADLILLDIEMPKLGGLQFLEMLRQLPEWKHTPVIIMTGRPHAQTRVRAAQLGAVEYVAKTRDFTESLLKQVEQNLIRPRKKAAS